MISLDRIKILTAFTLIFILTVNCTSNQRNKNRYYISRADSCSVTVHAVDYVNSKSGDVVKISGKNRSYVKTGKGGWLEYKVQIPGTGRYKILLFGATSDSARVACWIEDYVDNKDGRMYNITGNMMLNKASQYGVDNMIEKDGSPWIQVCMLYDYITTRVQLYLIRSALN